MRLLILLSLFLLLTSFGHKTKIISSCHFDVISSVVFPIEGDSTIYLKRYFSSDQNYLIESIYENGKEVYKTEMRGQNLINVDDFRNENISLESSNISWPNSRTFNLKKDSATFNICYYANGFISECGLIKNSCYCSNVYKFDSLNTSYWTGLYNNKTILDTVYGINELGEHTLRIYQKCSNDSVGTWYKYSCNNEIVDSAHCKINKTKNVLRKTHSR